MQPYAPVAVTIKKFRAGPGGTKVEERQQARAVTLPKCENVPKYTSYMYAAYENSHVVAGGCTRCIW